MKLYDVSSLKDFDKTVSEFLPNPQLKEVFWLTGPLGIGKSEWVRKSLKFMGFKNSVPSPSFSIQNSYQIKNKKIEHIDLYRIQNEDDLESFPFYNLFSNSKINCIYVEWADRIHLYQKLPEWNQTFLNFKWKNQKRILMIQED